MLQEPTLLASIIIQSSCHSFSVEGPQTVLISWIKCHRRKLKAQADGLLTNSYKTCLLAHCNGVLTYITPRLTICAAVFGIQDISRLTLVVKGNEPLVASLLLACMRMSSIEEPLFTIYV